MDPFDTSLLPEASFVASEPIKTEQPEEDEFMKMQEQLFAVKPQKMPPTVEPQKFALPNAAFRKPAMQQMHSDFEMRHTVVDTHTVHGLQFQKVTSTHQRSRQLLPMSPAISAPTAKPPGAHFDRVTEWFYSSNQPNQRPQQAYHYPMRQSPSVQCPSHSLAPPRMPGLPFVQSPGVHVQAPDTPSFSSELYYSSSPTPSPLVQPDSDSEYDDSLYRSPPSSPLYDDDEENMKSKSKKRLGPKAVEPKLRRQISFCKRKVGLLKKTHQLVGLTGAQALLVLVSETGSVHSYATKDFFPLLNPESPQEAPPIAQVLEKTMEKNSADGRSGPGLVSWNQILTPENFDELSSARPSRARAAKTSGAQKKKPPTKALPSVESNRPSQPPPAAAAPPTSAPHDVQN